MGEPLTAEPSPAAPDRRRPCPSGCRAAIWIGIVPCLPPRAGAMLPDDACAEIVRFIDAHVPGARAGSTAPGVVSLRCAGSLTQVMHIADELTAHLQQVSESEDAGGFDVHLGIAIAGTGETVDSMLHRAEDAAESWAA